ncbi:MAG: rhomboid family intramembrane serine protease [Kofleriaceae bacterium]
MAKLRITYNAPVVLTFALAAVAVQILSQVIGLGFVRYFVAPTHLDGAASYLGLVTHILGHANWDHLLSNFTIILLIGPILEERHGSAALAVMIVITALVTGLINVTFSSHPLLGASGIAFMFVVLASMANIRHGEVPLTFIAIALLFLGREVVNSFRDDNVSQMAHLVGGATGGLFGFLGAKRDPKAAKAAKPLPPLVAPAQPARRPGSPTDAA